MEEEVKIDKSKVGHRLLGWWRVVLVGINVRLKKKTSNIKQPILVQRIILMK